MQKNKLYNIFFPIWLMIYFPPIVFLVLIINLIIDGVVILLGLKLTNSSFPYKKIQILVLKVWGWGFLADIIGSIMLLLLEETINMNIWNIWLDLKSLVVHFIIVIMVGIIIFIFNYRLLIKQDLAKKVCFKIAIAMAILTAPWIFLIPTVWMYPNNL